MSGDERMRALMRTGEATWHDLARRGLCLIRPWDGYGDNGLGSGCGCGSGFGYGSGFGEGAGSGDGYGSGSGFGLGLGSGFGLGLGSGFGLGCGSGYGNGNGNGHGYGHGNGNGNGNGHGDGDGNGNGKPTGEIQVDYTQIMEAGTPVMARSYVSGVIVGRLVGGGGGSVALREWRWIRRWEGVGGEGSCYDLAQSDVVPSQRGPLTPSLGVFSQADVMEISEACYARLAL